MGCPRTIRVLHVDDREDDLELTKLQLQKLAKDLVISWAKSPKQALKKLEKGHFDCVISDYQMPKMDGLELLHTIRKKGNSIPFIFLTGRGNEEIAAHALRDGADDYYTKELSFALYDRLLNSIRRVVADRERQLKLHNVEKVLRKVEERYELLFSKMPEGFALYEIICDDKGKPCNCRLLDINPAFERLSGFERDEVIGKTVHEVLPDTEFFLIETYSKVTITGRPARFKKYIKALDRYYDVVAFCPKEGQFALILSDITKRERTRGKSLEAKEDNKQLV